MSFGASFQDPEIDYGISMLRNPLDFKRWGIFHLQLPKPYPPELKQFQFTYVSPYRPIVGSQFLDWGVSGVFIIPVHNHTASLVLTHEPLPLDRVWRYELSPYFGKTRGHYIMQLAVALGTHVELVRQGARWDAPIEVAVLFKNPRRKWQMSYFVQDLGPTGHNEATDDPERLVEEAYTSGFRAFSPGILDDIAPSFSSPGGDL